MPRELTPALTLIVTDLHLAGDHGQGSGSVDAPPLEFLEFFLARARAAGHGDWRRWLASSAGMSGVEVPVAAVSRCADHVPQPGEWWLANPVHFEAALDHVRLSRLLAMSTEEWAEIAGAFNAAFSPGPLRFDGARGSNGYLLAGEPLGAQTVDPTRVVGNDVHGWMPGGPGSAELKRLMTEVQMWLHVHPLNARREALGQLPVTGLWIWGGGSLPESSATAPSSLLYTDDAFATGLWRLADAFPQPLPHRLEEVALRGRDAASSLASSVVIAVTLRQLAGDSDRERMITLDRFWIAPALSMLREGTVRELRLHANDRLFVARRSDLWRFWRGRGSWLRALIAPVQAQSSRDRE